MTVAGEDFHHIAHAHVADAEMPVEVVLDAVDNVLHDGLLVAGGDKVEIDRNEVGGQRIIVVAVALGVEELPVESLHHAGLEGLVSGDVCLVAREPGELDHQVDRSAEYARLEDGTVRDAGGVGGVDELRRLRRDDPILVLVMLHPENAVLAQILFRGIIEPGLHRRIIAPYAAVVAIARP